MKQRTKPPFRADHVGSLLRPAALKEAREQTRQGRDRRRGAEGGRGPRDRARHQETGGGRIAVDHRRRVPPLVVASRFPVGPRRRREARHGYRHRLRRGDDAQRRRPGHRQARLVRPSDGRAFQVRQSAYQPHAENDHSGAVGDLRPPGRDPDRQVHLSEARYVLRRSRPGLQQGGARLRRRRLPLPAARRSLHRHAVRPEVSPADDGSRRRSGKARPALRRPDQRRDVGHSAGHDRSPCICAAATTNRPSWAPAATTPRQEVLFDRINVHGYFMEYDTERAGGFEPLQRLPKGKSWCSASSPPRPARWKARTRSSAASTRRPSSADLDQLCLSPQCGFASTEEGNMLTEDEQWAKLRMIVEVAHEVWG